MLEIIFTALSAIGEGGGIDSGAGTLVVMPFTDPAMARRAAAQLSERAGVSGQLLAVYDPTRAGFVAVANRVFRRSQGARMAYVAQDAFAGRDWLRRAEQALAKDAGGLLGFNDGKWAGALAAFGMVERGWAATNYGGDLFHSGYRSHYADAELTVLALARGRYRYDPESLLIEVDWNKATSAADPADRAHYRQRAEEGFEGRVDDERLLRVFA